VAEFSVEGIVLRRWDSGESDRRVAVLTPDRGKIYITARGARKAGARLAAFTEPGTIAKFGVGARKNAYMTQVEPIGSFSALRADYLKLMCALALFEVIDAVSPEEHPVPEIFEEALRAVAAISEGEPVAALCWVDLRLMRATGHGPDFSGMHRFLSPEDGGSATASSRDSFEVSKEVAIALSRLQQIDAPPTALKRSGDVAKAILRFWETYAGKKLMARRSLMDSIK
jgi:DNA repair protein RecO (recombination protein O)